MDDDLRRLLGVGAVVGDEFDLDLVSGVAQLSAAAQSAARALGVGVLIEVPGGRARFRFVNALMQRYLYRERVAGANGAAPPGGHRDGGPSGTGQAPSPRSHGTGSRRSTPSSRRVCALDPGG